MADQPASAAALRLRAKKIAYELIIKNNPALSDKFQYEKPIGEMVDAIVGAAVLEVATAMRAETAELVGARKPKAKK